MGLLARKVLGRVPILSASGGNHSSRSRTRSTRLHHGAVSLILATHLFATGFPILVSADLADFIQEDLSPAISFLMGFSLQEIVLYRASV